MRDIKSLLSYTLIAKKFIKQKLLFKTLRKEVEIGANGTQRYVIKEGKNKGIIL
tara:strand:+ start:1549 stop:1710 length:162 start_codon:yes stop_codon:yes gene_type:complete